MEPIIGRDYCIRHPGEIIRLFGVGVWLGMLFGRKKSLLEGVAEHYALHGFPMPGAVGRAYRLAALIEMRVARIYGRLAQRFSDNPQLHAFFLKLQAEEEEHCRLMTLCRYTVALHPSLTFVPSLRDAKVRALLQRLRQLYRDAGAMGWDEALATTEALEKGEVNVLFGRLLKQTEQAASRLFEQKMAELENHAVSVPRQIRSLRQSLEKARA